MVAVPKTTIDYDYQLNSTQYNLAGNVRMLSGLLIYYNFERMTVALRVFDSVANKLYAAFTPQKDSNYFPGIGGISTLGSTYYNEGFLGKEVSYEFTPSNIPSNVNPNYAKLVPFYYNNKVVAFWSGGFEAPLSLGSIPTTFGNFFNLAQKNVNQLVPSYVDASGNTIVVNKDAVSQFGWNGLGVSATYFTFRKNAIYDSSNNFVDKSDFVRVFTTTTQKASSAPNLPATASTVPGTGIGTVYPVAFPGFVERCSAGLPFNGWLNLPNTTPMQRIWVTTEPVFDSIGGVSGLYGFSWTGSVHTVDVAPIGSAAESALAPSPQVIKNTLNQMKFAVNTFLEQLRANSNPATSKIYYTLWIKQLNSVVGNSSKYVMALTSQKADTTSNYRGSDVLDDDVAAQLDTVDIKSIDPTKATVDKLNTLSNTQVANVRYYPLVHPVLGTVYGAIETTQILRSHTGNEW